MKLPIGPKRAKLFCLIATGAVLIATLWPMNPFPRNGVKWLQQKNGIRLRKESLIISEKPLKLEANNDSYALELLLSPASVESSSTILAFYNPTASKQLLIRQLKGGLAVAQDSENEQDRTIRCDIGGVLSPGRLIFIAISSGPNGITFYVDGKRSYSFPGSKILPSDLAGRVLIGTSPLSYQPWSGNLYGLAVYAEELNDERALQHYQAWIHPESYSRDLDAALALYTFSEEAGTTIHNLVPSQPNLEIPSYFSLIHKGFLRSPRLEFKPQWHYAIDIVSNIVGFVPLGLIVCTYLTWTKPTWKAILLTIVFCALLSLSIEITQYYIPRRGSGITDIITNTLGGALGAALLQVASVRRQLQRMDLAPTRRN
jgi:VanZ family protein